jgi:hypothetical protein
MVEVMVEVQFLMFLQGYIGSILYNRFPLIFGKQRVNSKDNVRCTSVA